jgi:hypothetical protein
MSCSSLLSRFQSPMKRSVRSYLKRAAYDRFDSSSARKSSAES